MAAFRIFALLLAGCLLAHSIGQTITAQNLQAQRGRTAQPQMSRRTPPPAATAIVPRVVDDNAKFQ